jgi:hypothetical protein
VNIRLHHRGVNSHLPSLHYASLAGQRHQPFMQFSDHFRPDEIRPYFSLQSVVFARASRSAAEAPLPPVFGFVHACGYAHGVFLAHRTNSRPVLRVPEVDLLRSSMVPTNLRCPLPVCWATNLVADVEVGSRCLLNFFRRSIHRKSYISTSYRHRDWPSRENTMPFTAEVA